MKFFRLSLGPAFITASVVIGPGSIVTSSKVGATFGFDMVWLLVVTTALMIAMTGLSARLGIGLERTPCQEVAHRAGRPLAVLIGLSAFAITTCFQSGNNVGILTALESWTSSEQATAASGSDWGPAIIVIAMNVALVVFLFGFSKLYRSVERVMMLLVGVMLVAFATNLVFVFVARWVGAVSVPPTVESGSTMLGQSLLPRLEAVSDGRALVDPWGPMVALFATSFSIAAAFFQAYLVRQKGWTVRQIKEGMIDTYSGIAVLNFITLLIMLTAAVVLRGTDIRSAGDIAAGLAPLYQSAAQKLFCLGLLAASLSSLLINAAIGGALLADGLGLGCYFDHFWTKVFTVVGLVVGLVVALVARASASFNAVNLILFAQAATVIAWPLLAGVLLWLSRSSDLQPAARPPRWMQILCWCGLVVALVLAPRTAYSVYLRLRIERQPPTQEKVVLPSAHAKAGHRVRARGPRPMMVLSKRVLFARTHHAGQTAVVRPVRIVPEGNSLLRTFCQHRQLFRRPGGSFGFHKIIRHAGLEVLIVTTCPNGLKNVPHCVLLPKQPTKKQRLRGATTGIRTHNAVWFSGFAPRTKPSSQVPDGRRTTCQLPLASRALGWRRELSCSEQGGMTRFQVNNSIFTPIGPPSSVRAENFPSWSLIEVTVAAHRRGLLASRHNPACQG